MPRAIQSARRWLSDRPAYLLLTADDERLARERPQRFARAWVGLGAISILWGAGAVGVYGGAWKLFGEYSGMRFMPSISLTAVMLLWLYRRPAGAMGECLSPRGGAGAIGQAVIALVLFAAYLEVDAWQSDWAHWLPPAWRWIRPQAMYRPIFLAPLWGAWAMMILPHLCRITERTESSVVAFARGCGPATASGLLVVPAAWTIWYFDFLPWHQLSISAVAVAAAVGGGVWICRRTGGLTRQGMLASNLLTQIAFLLGYIANVR